VHVGEEEAGGRRTLVDGDDDLDWLGNSEAEGHEGWGRAEEPRLSVAEEARPLLGVRARGGELRHVHDVDAEGRGRCWLGRRRFRGSRGGDGC
jgi:hypothetical protein